MNFTHCSRDPIVDFEQVNASSAWIITRRGKFEGFRDLFVNWKIKSLTYSCDKLTKTFRKLSTNTATIVFTTQPKICLRAILLEAINTFHATDLFWYPLKTSEIQRLSDVFRGTKEISGMKWVNSRRSS